MSHTVKGGGAPAWFMPAIQQALQPITDQINGLTATLNQVARLSALVSDSVS